MIGWAASGEFIQRVPEKHDLAVKVSPFSSVLIVYPGGQEFLTGAKRFGVRKRSFRFGCSFLRAPELWYSQSKAEARSARFRTSMRRSVMSSTTLSNF